MTTEEKPNAIILHGGATEKLARSNGSGKAGETEVGVKGIPGCVAAEHLMEFHPPASPKWQPI